MYATAAALEYAEEEEAIGSVCVCVHTPLIKKGEEEEEEEKEILFCPDG